MFVIKIQTIVVETSSYLFSLSLAKFESHNDFWEYQKTKRPKNSSKTSFLRQVITKILRAVIIFILSVKIESLLRLMIIVKSVNQKIAEFMQSHFLSFFNSSFLKVVMKTKSHRIKDKVMAIGMTEVNANSRAFLSTSKMVNL